MSSLLNSSAAALLSLRLSRPSLPPPPSFLPVRLQEPPCLLLHISRTPARGLFSVSSSQSGRRRQRKGKRDDRGDDTSDYDASGLASAADLVDREQLFPAGRDDTSGRSSQLDLEECTGGSCAWRPKETEKEKEVRSKASRRNPEKDQGEMDDSGKKDPSSDMWRTWSLSRSGFLSNEFEAAEIASKKDMNNVDYNTKNYVMVNDEFDELAPSIMDADGRSILPKSDAKEGGINQISFRLQQLESELKSVLEILKPRTNSGLLQAGQRNPVKELRSLRDALDFQETEITNVRDKLRSARAKLASLEGKVALNIIESEKVDDEHKLLDGAQKALCLPCTTCIVWPNSASEVKLVGSFDGWTTQRPLERSSRGTFSLFLKLYPGRYEIKFIVDGEWKIDPLRPVVHNNGHKNNLLIIP